ncbi:MAG: hypothetical protein MRECE_2c126 [Mycoplasmataceae bacterium CE_OT135]|nr:MAG: hypothetical protein MRECE_2c126 [Mycoplasmataceae bacterium CE_OT135]
MNNKNILKNKLARALMLTKTLKRRKLWVEC